MGILSGIWKYIAGALALVAGMLGAALLYTGNQRDRAKEAARRARAEAKSKSEVLETERSIDKARIQARKNANEVQREDDQRPDGERPTGSLRR